MNKQIAMSNSNKPTNAFVLRQSPCGKSQLEAISLPENVIVNGWAEARGLHELGDGDYDKCRSLIAAAYPSGGESMHKAGYAAGTMWRFVKAMKIGDWVVVPHSGGLFYLAEITSEAFYDDSPKAHEAHSCYRRRVTWLNNKQPLNRKIARSRLISRMKTQQTSANAGDLINEIFDALLEAAAPPAPSSPTAKERFRKSLRTQLVQATLDEIQNGYMDERAFEGLIEQVARAVGACSTEIVPRPNDKGVDIKATFDLGPAEIVVGIQVKYYKGELSDNWPIDQLIQGLEDEELTFGWLVTSGTIPDALRMYLKEKLTGTALQIEMIGGEELAGMIVDVGLQLINNSNRES